MLNYKQIIDEVKTPTYLYDINKLIDRVNYLKSKFNNNIGLVYAVKANTFIAKELESEVERFEICSKGEFDICNNLGISHSKMVISGVNKDYESIDEMLSKYDDIYKYTIESMNQYKLLKELSKKYNRNINLLIRLTSGNQFGVTEEEFIEILKDNDSNLKVTGIEYFSGTQKHSIKKINKEVDYLLDFLERVKEETNIVIDEIEYGPGLPVFYFQDEEFDEDSFLDEVNLALSRIKNKKIVLELGRSIAASCGYYFTSVADMKTNKNGNYVILDGGINQIVYYGQTMAMRIPYFDLYQKEEKKETDNYNLYGSLCTVNDIIVKNINVNKLSLGDTFIFKNVGAYSVTEGIALFLSRDLPKVVLYKDDKIIVVRDILKTSKINYPNY